MNVLASVPLPVWLWVTDSAKACGTRPWTLLEISNKVLRMPWRGQRQASALSKTSAEGEKWCFLLLQAFWSPDYGVAFHLCFLSWSFSGKCSTASQWHCSQLTKSCICFTDVPLILVCSFFFLLTIYSQPIQLCCYISLWGLCSKSNKFCGVVCFFLIQVMSLIHLRVCPWRGLCQPNGGENKQ